MTPIRAIRGLIPLMLVLAATAVVTGEPRQQGAALPPALAAAVDAIRAERLMAHLTTLASDAFEGRGPATPGETRTVDYLVEQFTLAGLQPGNPDGTYIQQVPLVGYTSVPEIQIEAAGQRTSLTFLDDFVHDYPARRTFASAPHAAIVFAGYGIVAPEYGWNDYAGVDVRNKLVLVLGGEPSRPGTTDPKTPDPAFFKGNTRTYYSTRDFKFELAAKKGAAGILVVSDPSASRTYSLFQTFARMEGFGLASGRTDGPVIAGLITTGYGLSTLDEALGEAARLQGRTFVTQGLDNGSLYFASDQIEFAKVGIPAVFPFSGSTYVGQSKEFGDARWNAYSAKDYHKVTDEVRPDWNLSGAAEDARWLLIAGYNVANADKRPAWKRGSEFKR